MSDRVIKVFIRQSLNETRDLNLDVDEDINMLVNEIIDLKIRTPEDIDTNNFVVTTIMKMIAGFLTQGDYDVISARDLLYVPLVNNTNCLPSFAMKIGRMLSFYFVLKICNINNEKINILRQKILLCNDLIDKYISENDDEQTMNKIIHNLKFLHAFVKEITGNNRHYITLILDRNHTIGKSCEENVFRFSKYHCIAYAIDVFRELKDSEIRSIVKDEKVYSTIRTN